MPAPDTKNETPLNQGLDSKTNTYVAPNGASFDVVEEARHDEPGTLIKRGRPFRIARLNQTPALDDRIQTIEHEFRSVMSSGGALGALHDTGLVAYTDIDDLPVDRPRPGESSRGNGSAVVEAFPFTIDRFTGFAEFGGYLHGTTGQVGEFADPADDEIDEFAWYDAETGVLIATEDAGLSTLSVLVVASNVFRVVYEESTGDFRIATFDGSTWSLLAAFTNHTDQRCYAAASVGVDPLGQFFYVMAPKDNADRLDIFRFDVTDGTQVGSSVNTVMKTSVPGNLDISVALVGTDTSIAVVALERVGGDLLYRRYIDDGSVLTLQNSFLFSNSFFPDSLGIVAVVDSAQDVDAFLVLSAHGDSSDAPKFAARAFKGNTQSVLKTIDNARLIGKPFQMGGGHFALAMHDILRTNPESTVPDPICILVQFEDTSRGWSIAGHVGVDRGYDRGVRDELPSFFHFKYRQLQNFRPQVSGGDARAWILFPDFPSTTVASAERVRPLRLALDAAPPDVVKIQGGAYAIGAQLQQWIGSSRDGLVANAFAYAPTGDLEGNIIDPVVLFPTGDYIGSMVLTWVDDLGRVHRSAPSVLSEFTAGVSFEPEFHNVLLPPGAPDDVLELYMSQDTGTRLIFYGSVTRAELEANGNVAIPPFSNFFRPGIEQGQKFIYTDGGALPNIAQPAAHSGAVIQDRLWLGDAADRQVWWFSKPAEEGVAFEFNPEFRIRIPGGTAGTATAQINGRPLMFTSVAVWTVHGDGPLRTGAGAFSLPVQISNIGCVARATVAETPVGVFFAGARGLYRVIAGLQVQPVALGADFELDASKVTRATVDEKRTEVVFHRRTEDGGPLVYNYLHDKLTTWPTMDARDAVQREVIDQMVFLDTTSLRELSYLGGAELVGLTAMRLTTHWIKLDGFQGNATVRELVFSAELVEGHGIRFDLWFDYEDSTGDGSQLEVFDGASIDAELVGDVYTLTFPIDAQTARSVKVRITEESDGQPGLGFKPLNLAIISSSEDGIQRRYGETGRQ